MTTATAIGSMPGTAYDEAVRIVLGELPGLPHVPELPARGPHADMTGRTLAIAAGLGADLQPAGRSALGDWPLEARLALVRNLGADDQRDGARFSLVLGSRLRPGGWEFGYSNQRIQRDAVLAAFNEDDWWFHSFTHGFMPWIGYGLGERWNLRLAAFREQRNGLPRHTDRVLIDLAARW